MNFEKTCKFPIEGMIGGLLKVPSLSYICPSRPHGLSSPFFFFSCFLYNSRRGSNEAPARVLPSLPLHLPISLPDQASLSPNIYIYILLRAHGITVIHEGHGKLRRTCWREWVRGHQLVGRPFLSHRSVANDSDGTLMGENDGATTKHRLQPPPLVSLSANQFLLTSSSQWYLLFAAKVPGSSTRFSVQIGETLTIDPSQSEPFLR